MERQSHGGPCSDAPSRAIGMHYPWLAIRNPRKVAFMGPAGVFGACNNFKFAHLYRRMRSAGGNRGSIYKFMMYKSVAAGYGLPNHYRDGPLNVSARFLLRVLRFDQ